jgi:hypothetical protein
MNARADAIFTRLQISSNAEELAPISTGATPHAHK